MAVSFLDVQARVGNSVERYSEKYIRTTPVPTPPAPFHGSNFAGSGLVKTENHKQAAT